MNERLLFPEMGLFKKDVAELFISILRNIYKEHPVYTYSDNEEETNVLITPSYGDVEFPGEKPKIVAKVSGYNLDFQDSFYQNMEYTAYDHADQTAGFKNWKMLNTTITLLVRAYAEEESSDVADELSMLAAYAFEGEFREAGITVRGAQVSETELSDRSNDIFQTAVSLQTVVSWEFSKQSDEYIDSVTVEPELPEELRGSYRRPGVTVLDDDDGE